MVEHRMLEKFMRNTQKNLYNHYTRMFPQCDISQTTIMRALRKNIESASGRK